MKHIKLFIYFFLVIAYKSDPVTDVHAYVAGEWTLLSVCALLISYFIRSMHV